MKKNPSKRNVDHKTGSTENENAHGANAHSQSGENKQAVLSEATNWIRSGEKLIARASAAGLLSEAEAAEATKSNKQWADLIASKAAGAQATPSGEPTA